MELKNHIKLTDILYIIEENRHSYVNVIRLLMTLIGQNNVYPDLQNIKIYFLYSKFLLSDTKMLFEIITFTN